MIFGKERFIIKKSSVLSAVLICTAITAAAAGAASHIHQRHSLTKEIVHSLSADYNAGKSVTLSDAKEKALKDAGVSSDDAVFTKAETDYDDGVKVYEIEFHTDTKKYEYEIRVSDGKILEKNSESCKKTSSTKSISLSSAKKKALNDAGVSSDDAVFTKAETDYDDGVKVYEIEFHTDTKKYEYEIRVSDGKILEKNSESCKKTSSTKSISLSSAKKKALNDAGVSSDDAVFTKAETDYDDGVKIYDIEFHTDTKKYEYEINASNGKIIEKDSENYQAPSSKTITRNEALKIAYKDAGVSEKDVTLYKCKLEHDDGIYVYEIEFVSSSMEYEYEINAETGKIISEESESID